MNKRKTDNGLNKRYVSLKEFANYCGIGLTSAKKAAVQIGAERKIFGRCVYDLQTLDDFFAKSNAITETMDPAVDA